VPPARAQAPSAPPSAEPLPDAPGWYVVRRRGPGFAGDEPLFPFDEALVRELPVRKVAPARPRRPIARVLGMAAAGLALLLLGLALVHARWLERPIGGPAEAWALLVAEPPSEPRSMPQPESTVSIAGAKSPAAVAGQDEPARPQPGSPRGDAAAREAAVALDRLIADSQDRADAADDASAAAVLEVAASDTGVGRPVGGSAPPAARVARGEPSPPGTTSPDSAGIRVFIHYASTDVENAALARRLADHLRRAGFTVADLRPVDLPIEQPSVRYFFEDDRRASQRLVDVLARFFEQARLRTPERASDFTHHTPKPRVGNVEVWLRTS
jgi:hypothetical protein